MRSTVAVTKFVKLFSKAVRNPKGTESESEPRFNSVGLGETDLRDSISRRVGQADRFDGVDRW